jgi:putative endonuclease
MSRGGWIYILQGRTGTLYTGVTSDLVRRVLQHRAGIRSGFATKYDCHRLVYFEVFASIMAAIHREKVIKGWTRAKKLALIESKNPEWRDLAKFWGAQMLTGNESIAEAELKERQRIRLSLDSSPPGQRIRNDRRET